MAAEDDRVSTSRSGGHGHPRAPGRPPTAVVGLALAGLALVGLFRVPPVQAEPRTVELAIHNGELPKEQRVVVVRQGDDVTLRWTTDRALEIHLHGYDLEKKLAPGTPALMRFPARATGRFPIEVHAHGADKERVLGYLEVHPR